MLGGRERRCTNHDERDSPTHAPVGRLQTQRSGLSALRSRHVRVREEQTATQVVRGTHATCFGCLPVFLLIYIYLHSFVFNLYRSITNYIKLRDRVRIELVLIRWNFDNYNFLYYNFMWVNHTIRVETDSIRPNFFNYFVCVHIFSNNFFQQKNST